MLPVRNLPPSRASRRRTTEKSPQPPVEEHLPGTSGHTAQAALDKPPGSHWCSVRDSARWPAASPFRLQFLCRDSGLAAPSVRAPRHDRARPMGRQASLGLRGPIALLRRASVASGQYYRRLPLFRRGTLVLTNAAGGIHPSLTPGNFMGIRDHIEWNRPFAGVRPVPAFDRPRRENRRTLQSLLVSSCCNGGAPWARHPPGSLRGRDRPEL